MNASIIPQNVGSVDERSPGTGQIKEPDQGLFYLVVKFRKLRYPSVSQQEGMGCSALVIEVERIAHLMLWL